MGVLSLPEKRVWFQTNMPRGHSNLISDSCQAVCIVLTIFFLSADPSRWSSKDIAQWLEWAMQEFGLDAIDVAKFQLNGTQLLSLSKEDFLERTPPYTGDVLYAHLKLLQARSGKKEIARCIQ